MSVTQVHQLLGLMSDYRRFIHQLAQVASLMHNFTKKDVEFAWTEECQVAELDSEGYGPETAAKFGSQWDRYLSGVLWAYRNTPHEATREKSSFLLFGIDCRTPTEAALLPPEPLEPTNVRDYREELVLLLSSTRELVAMNVRAAQRHYKKQYDKRTQTTDYRLGDWVLIRFLRRRAGNDESSPDLARAI